MGSRCQTPVPEVIHAGKIYAKLMDNDEDFTPDDPRIFDYHSDISLFWSTAG